MKTLAIKLLSYSGIEPEVILTWNQKQFMNLRGSLYVKGHESKLLFQSCSLKIIRKFLVETTKIRFMHLMVNCEYKLFVLVRGKYKQTTDGNSLF